MYMVVRVSGVQYTYGVGYGVAVWIRRQYQSLGMRNSKIAVPLFCAILVCKDLLQPRFPNMAQ